ncbi:MAG: right-handed parallel beta-helix repeat-containing protein [Armatimonadota bacterium]|nr:right-handed parallel beta-helix repeat-containing protein [Armatimonadota bacterium]MDW8025775.1 right-handed parallel beta-helix repeat-containing protein [Armatimonadota bacterium]
MWVAFVVNVALYSFFVATLILPASSLRAAQVKLPPNERAIEEVKQGKHKVAYASWWGFDPEDATNALQAAIDSGVPKLIIDDVGKPWVVSRTINLRSDQEIVFEKGVVVEAKQGAFLGRGDCLFLAALQKNITLIGYGATLRMRKLDYTKPPYERAEWRHALSIRSCDNVRIYGLTLASSGGDGIYLGVAKRGIPCTNIHIKDVVCIDNYRQGISVISAENVLMENVVMRDTGGTPPMAGIDFEPNDPTERLSNIVMRNCISQNNAGDGFAFYLHNLNATSHPVSIRLEGCKTIGNRRGVSISIGNSKDKTVKGIIEFVDCEFEGSEGAGIFIAQKPPFGCKISFFKCKVSNAAAKQPTQAPIMFASARGNFEPIGGVEFVDCIVQDEVERLPFAYLDFAGGLELVEVAGTITLMRGGLRSEYKLTRELLNQWFPTQAFKVFPPIDVGVALATKLSPLFPDAKLVKGVSSNARLRGRAEFLIWARAGEKVEFTLTVQPVGRIEVGTAKVSMVTPSGRTIAMKDAVSERECDYKFVADEKGAYRIVCDAGWATVTMKWCSHRFCLSASDGVFHFLGTAGEFYFFVPAGVGEFGVKVAGGNELERVKVTLSDELGRVVGEKDNIAQAHQFVIARDDAKRGSIYSLRFQRPSVGVLEDFYVQLQGIPPLLAPAREALLVLPLNADN